MRRGELLGLQWVDVDFERSRIGVRRAYVRGHVTSPKSGRGRFVVMAPALADVLAARRRQALALGWAETPK